MLVEARRSFECEVIDTNGVGHDVMLQEGDTFNVSGLLYVEENDTYNLELPDGSRMECIPGTYVM